MSVKSTDSKKSEINIDSYNTGFPLRKGWYDCLLDGEVEERLYCFVCEMDHRKRYWVDSAGAKVLEEVRWR